MLESSPSPTYAKLFNRPASFCLTLYSYWPTAAFSQDEALISYSFCHYLRSSGFGVTLGFLLSMFPNEMVSEDTINVEGLDRG